MSEQLLHNGNNSVALIAGDAEKKRQGGKTDREREEGERDRDTQSVFVGETQQAARWQFATTVATITTAKSGASGSWAGTQIQSHRRDTKTKNPK